MARDPHRPTYEVFIGGAPLDDNYRLVRAKNTRV